MAGRQRRHLLTPLVERVFRTRTVHDARRIVRAIQLLLSFGLLIVLPNLLLATFAISSIQSQSSLEAELAPRTSGVIDQVLSREQEFFEEFEQQVERRLTRNVKPVTGLDELSPHLLAAFVVDPDGQLVEPFDVPASQDLVDETPAYAQAWRRGVQAELAGRHKEAWEAFDVAIALTTNRRLKAQARLAAARNAVELGDEDAYVDVMGEYGLVRDPRGFRVGDLARLNQAEARAARSLDGAYALQELAEFLIDDARWTLEEGGEPTIARYALTRLEELQQAGAPIESDWIDRARRRLDRRDAQLFKSADLYKEALDLASAPPGTSEGWVYQPAPSSGTLWAIRNTGTSLVLYAFDKDEVLDELRRTATRIVAPDPDLVAGVGRIDAPTTPTTFRKPLERMPMDAVQVAAANPQALETERTNRTFLYFGIILLVLATSVVGILVTVRTVSRELEAARVKTDFAANVSHELRSPITQIRLKGEALQLDLVYDDDDRQSHYDAIVREAERLSRLVDNVLDFAAIERGAKKYTLRPEDLTTLIHSAVEVDRGRMEANGISIEVDVPDDLPVVWMDREAMSQVLINLLSNAAKYGGDGKWVGVSARADAHEVEIRVSDRGMGISTEDQKRVFEDFFRSSDPAVRRRKGTGIGLTIVRYIVEAHGGRIAVESAPGKGATFVIHLPLQPPDGAGA